MYRSRAEQEGGSGSTLTHGTLTGTHRRKDVSTPAQHDANGVWQERSRTGDRLRAQDNARAR